MGPRGERGSLICNVTPVQERILFLAVTMNIAIDQDLLALRVGELPQFLLREEDLGV